mgnify:CR=1 FL=1
MQGLVVWLGGFARARIKPHSISLLLGSMNKRITAADTGGYPPGAVLTLDDDQADWLISLGRAEDATLKADPEKAPAKPAKAGK